MEADPDLYTTDILACPVTLDTLLSDPAEPALLVERIEQAMRG